MKYLEVAIQITPPSEDAADLLAALLADIGFESFVQTEQGVTAYVQETLFSNEEFNGCLCQFPMAHSFVADIKKIEEKNWNEEWEKNYFQPIVIENQCVIHSSFHTNIPEVPYDIVIDPKMAFGTGHHETTFLMLKQILSCDLKNKSVLDMGCGTAVLAILAEMRGATPITAIDIDEWATENSLENIRLNNAQQVKVLLGGAELLGAESFDVVFANINRNILLNDMHQYVKVMQKESTIFFSGFYTDDLSVITEEANRQGLKYVSHLEKNNWVAARFEKI